MPAAPSDAAPPSRLYHGWKVVAVAFLVAFVGWGLGFYGPSVYLVALRDTRGWSTASISGVITLYYLAGGACVVLAGEAFRRWDPRWTVTLGGGALVAGVVLMARAPTPGWLVAAFLVMALGWALGSGAAVAALVAPWFVRRRGFATSLAFNGASLGGVVMVPVWAALIGVHGLPAATLIVGAAVLALLWPLAWLVLRPGPAALGLAPDGDGAAPARPAPPEASPGVTAMLRNPRFWTVTGPFAVTLFVQVGVLTHQYAFLSPSLGGTDAAFAVSLTTFAAIVGRLGLGLFVDRMDARIASAGVFAVQIAALLLMLAGPPPAWLYVACALYGLGVGNMISLPPIVVQAEFPAAAFLRAVTLGQAVYQFTFAFAPGVAGAVREVTGGYGAALAGAAVLMALAGAVLVAGRVRRPAASSR